MNLNYSSEFLDSNFNAERLELLTNNILIL